MSLIQGQAAERQALGYLQRQGLKLVTQNYHCRLGEIDLIMLDKNYLVFIEVRARKSSNYGGGLTSVTSIKQKKILKTAQYYLLNHADANKHALRFDVLSMDGLQQQIHWIKDAFGMDY
ncbi:MAG: YraN family protein [Legionella sp.]|nr:YraN family protein [Legionella sp.]